MKDLFDIFPDLPWPKKRPIHERLQEVRARAEDVHQRMNSAILVRRAVARRAQDAWRRKVGR